MEHSDERYGTVGNWMTRDPAAVTEDSSLQSALDRMRQAEIRHLLVFDGDRLTGILSTRDLRRLTPSDARIPVLSEPVSHIMTENPVTIAPETPVAMAARVLLESKIGALPVRDGDVIVGIFTTSDALEALLAMVERPGA